MKPNKCYSMKKGVLLIACAAAFSVAHARHVKTSSANKTAPVPVANANGPQWEGSAAAAIPMSNALPKYDSLMAFGDTYDRNQLDGNAQQYFTKTFNSRDVKVHKHKYAVTGMYMFCADRTAGAAGMFQVNYNLEVTISRDEMSVAMSDFRIKNQNTEVSMTYLLARAKENDGRSLKILSYFHNNNLLQIGHLFNAIAPGVASTPAVTVK
ncbi:MAG: hypothetical protein EBZ77_00285 [Chitinophagia bacterium]|nr:hypothetical protein [Chitinophagia bacterium]